MQRDAVLYLSLALAVAVAAVALFAARSDGEIQVPPAPPAAAPDPTNAAQPEPVRPPPVIPADALRVRIAVTAKERFVPPPPVGVLALRAGDNVPLAAFLVAGAGAGWDASPNAAGAALAMVEGEGARWLRQAVVGPEASPVLVGAPLVVRGQILDHDRKPVRGAAAWFGEVDGDGRRREFVVDDRGAFEANVAAGERVPFVATAPGHASQWRTIAVWGPPGPADAVLARGCVLEVQLTGLALGLEHARLFVVPQATVATGLGQWPFFAQALTDGVPFDDNGRAEVADLPGMGEVGLVVRHPRVALGRPVGVVLKEGRVRATVPVQFAASEWRGSVVDEQGLPRALVQVWGGARSFELAAGNAQRFVPPHLDVAGTFAAVTDDAGAFALGASDGAGALLKLRWPGCAGRDLPWNSLPAGQPIVLPAWRGGEPELKVAPPRAGVPWFVETDLAGGITEALPADGVFRVSLPYAGRFDVELVTFVGSEERGRERVRDAMVTGTVELAAPKLP